MKICPLCQATYSDRIDFCFEDGEVLVGAPRVENGVIHDELLDPPSSEVPITGEVPLGAARRGGISRAPMPTLVPFDVASLGFVTEARPRDEDLDVPVPTRFQSTRTATPAPVVQRPAEPPPVVERSPEVQAVPPASPMVRPSAEPPVAAPAPAVPVAPAAVPAPVIAPTQPPVDDEDDEDLRAFSISAPQPAALKSPAPTTSGGSTWIWVFAGVAALVVLVVVGGALALGVGGVLVGPRLASAPEVPSSEASAPVDVSPPLPEPPAAPVPEALTELADAPVEEEPVADAGTAAVEAAPVVSTAPPPSAPAAPPRATTPPPPVPTAIAPAPTRPPVAPRGDVPRTEPKPAPKPAPAASAAAADDNPWGTVEPAAPKKGKVVVLMAGQAQGHELLVDGQRVGKLPVTLELAEGSHQFAVEKVDGGRMQVTREVKFEGAKPVFINL